eukprot:2071026-Rhodomonas_salina.1
MVEIVDRVGGDADDSRPVRVKVVMLAGPNKKQIGAMVELPVTHRGYLPTSSSAGELPEGENASSLHVHTTLLCISKIHLMVLSSAEFVLEHGW